MTAGSVPRVELFYFDAGGGHRSAATALRDVMAAGYPGWRVELVNLQDVLQPLDIVHLLTGVKAQEVYNKILKYGLTYGSMAMLRGVQRIIRLNSGRIERVLAGRWRESPPDMVVSLIPNFNGPMFRALRAAGAAAPYVTVMTDLADCPPHFWQERQDQYLVCGTDLAVRQARSLGYPRRCVFRTSGMVLKPSFYVPQLADRAAERERLGLDPSMPTALVMFGGYGAMASAAIARKLAASRRVPAQCIVMCGHNERLVKKLRGVPRCLAVGFTKEVPYYMHLADFFIGKPGPGSVSEALHMGLPVIVECNARTMPQERPNAQWIEKRKLGIVVKSFSGINAAVEALLEGPTLRMMRERAGRLDNRAVYEIPPLLERIMKMEAAKTKPVSPRSRNRAPPESAGPRSARTP